MDELSFQAQIQKIPLDLPSAALSYARGIAYPGLDLRHYLARLDELAADAANSTPQGGSQQAIARGLADFLFRGWGFRGNREAYADPRNSYLNEVLDRRLGIPISLSVIYLEVARRLELPAYGVGLPGHFVVGIPGDEGPWYLDPFHGGRPLSEADCAELVRMTSGFNGPMDPAWLHPVTDEQILSRMLNNLRLVTTQQEDWPTAISVVEHLHLLQPENPCHLRDLGLLYYRAGALRDSIRLLKAYLRTDPEPRDARFVRRSLRFVALQLARLN